MSNLDLLINKKVRTSSNKLTRNSKLFRAIIHAIQEKKGTGIVSLDLKKIPEAVSDFFIICQASNPIQLNSIADFVREEVKNKCGEKPYSVGGERGEHWILIDYINIVVHIMTEETRKFYRLEEMWSDANVKEHII